MSQSQTDDATQTHKAYDLAPGQVFETWSGERLQIVGYGDTERTLRVRYPERPPQLDADGEQFEHHHAFIDRYSFADMATYEDMNRVSTDGPTLADETDADEPERLPGEFVETPRCPVCARFMSCEFDGAGLPAAQCSRVGCHGWLDDRELIERGYFEEGA